MNSYLSTYEQLINEDWKNPLTWSRTAQHVGLGLGGMVPGIGLPADMTNAVMYYNDNDKVGYWISVVSMIPTGDIAKLLIPYKGLKGPIKDPGVVRVLIYFLKKGNIALNIALNKTIRTILKSPRAAKWIESHTPWRLVVNGIVDDAAIAKWVDSILNPFLRWCNSKLTGKVPVRNARGQWTSNKPGPISRAVDWTGKNAEELMNPRALPLKGWGANIDRLGTGYMRTKAGLNWGNPETRAAAEVINQNKINQNEINQRKISDAESYSSIGL